VTGLRGARAIEVYQNTLYIEDDADGIFLSNGDGLIWNNTLTGLISGAHAIMLDSGRCSDYLGDYPLPDQMRNTYIWGNTVNGYDADSDVYPTSPYGVGNYCTEFVAKDRDFFLTTYSYTPYPYPHPLRNS
jgi:hypothetical protein